MHSRVADTRVNSGDARSGESICCSQDFPEIVICEYPAVAQIDGCLAFYPDRVDSIEALED